MTRRLAGVILVLFALRLFGYALLDHFHRGLARDYCQWDCKWYVGIAGTGYQLSPTTAPGLDYGQANWAFFPLFPLLLRLLQGLLPVGGDMAGMIAANLFLLGFALLAVGYLARRRRGADGAALAAFLLAFPYGLYFSLPYTESLFAFLVTAALYALAGQRLGPAAALAGLASATRLTGILLAPVVALRALMPAYAAWRVGEHPAARGLAADALLPIAVAPLGLFLFMAYLRAHMGDGLAFAHIQEGWNRHAASPLVTLFGNVFAHDWQRAFARRAQSHVLGEYAALAGLAVCGRLAFLGLWPECWLLGGTVLLALAAGLHSMQRFVLANPVFLIFLFEWLWQSARFRRWFIPILIGLAGVQAWFVRDWLQAYVYLT